MGPRGLRHRVGSLSGPRAGAALLGALAVPAALIALAALGAPASAGATENTAIHEERPPVEPTTATIAPTFSPDRLGAKASLHFSLHFQGGEYDIPSPVRTSTLHLPVGLSLDSNHIASCSRAKLLAHGAKGCSRASLIGRGSALASLEFGAVPESEHAELWAFIGPVEGANPTVQILAEGITPLERRVIITGRVMPDNPPYGNKLVMNIPAIPTVPLEPNAATISLSLSIGFTKGGKGHAGAAVLLPKHCPTGGFPFLDEFSFEDHSSTEARGKAPCP